jgi:alpha-beta hydrolase superfamily lysophospholipase
MSWLVELGRTTAQEPSDRFRYGARPEQHVEYWPASTSPSSHTVVSIHGGAFMPTIDLTSHHPLCAELQSQGFDVYNIEYRRAGGTSRPDDTLDDARNALEAIAQRVDGEIAVVGHSVGGYLAEHVANAARVALTISLAPLTDLWRWGTETSPDRLLAWLATGSGDPEADARRLSLDPAKHVPGARLLIHGTNDTIVPFAISQDYAYNVLGSGQHIDFELIKGEGHFAFIDPTQTAFRRALKRLAEWRDA